MKNQKIRLINIISKFENPLIVSLSIKNYLIMKIFIKIIISLISNTVGKFLYIYLKFIGHLLKINVINEQTHSRVRPSKLNAVAVWCF